MCTHWMCSLFIPHPSLPIGKATPLSFLSHGHTAPPCEEPGPVQWWKVVESDVSRPRVFRMELFWRLVYLPPGKTQILLVAF